MLHGSCEPVWSQPGLPFPDQHGLSLCLPVSPCTDPEPQGPKPAPPHCRPERGEPGTPGEKSLATALLLWEEQGLALLAHVYYPF